MGYRTIDKFQFIPETSPIIKLLAIKISAIEISKLKIIIKLWKKRWERAMWPRIIKRYGFMQMILYIIKTSGNYRKRPKISERSKIHQKVWISTKEKLLGSNFDEIFIKVPQCLCVTFWPDNGGFSLKSRFSNNFLMSPQCLCVNF